MAKATIYRNLSANHKPIPTQARPGCGYLYAVAYSPEGPVKLGISVRPRTRIAELETAAGKRLACVAVSPECRNYREIEAELHKLLERWRGVGEWFNMSFHYGIRAIATRAFQRPPKARIPWSQLVAAANKIRPISVRHPKNF